MLKITYDAEGDELRVAFSDEAVVYPSPGDPWNMVITHIRVETDVKGVLVGIRIDSATRLLPPEVIAAALNVCRRQERRAFASTAET